MQQNSDTPYTTLDPDLILNAVESVGFHCSGSLLALNSYENRVYQIGIEDGQPLIAKFYRPGRWTTEAILEEHTFVAELVEREIPVIASLSLSGKTLHEYEQFRFALFPRQGGRALELDNLDQLEWMGRFIGRLHAIGASSSYQHRPRLDVKTHGYEPYQFLLNHHFIPPHLENNYRTTVATLLQKIAEQFQQADPIRFIRLHGDCHAGNVLWRDTGPHIVDLDDSVMGPAIQDIWMLLSGDAELIEVQLNRILRGYCDFHDFNRRELKLINAMRTLRMIQYAAWLASRWQDPAFPLHFPWFNTTYYWQEHLQNLTEQLYFLEEVRDCEY